MHVDTMAQCYFQSTVAEFDMAHEDNHNKELLYPCRGMNTISTRRQCLLLQRCWTI